MPMAMKYKKVEDCAKKCLNPFIYSRCNLQLLRVLFL